MDTFSLYLICISPIGLHAVLMMSSVLSALPFHSTVSALELCCLERPELLTLRLQTLCESRCEDLALVLVRHCHRLVPSL